MKISRFTNIIKKDGIYLLHNTLVNSVVRINAESRQKFIDTIESGKSFSLDPNDNFHLTLQALNMIVDESEDEVASLNSQFFMFEHSSELHIMLIVTRRCNFRCAYCYEKYIDSDMRPDIFEKTKKYILCQIERNKYKNIYISFFGGEPTLMAREINLFMEQLLNENNKLPYPANIKAVITTNGYLLTPKLIDEFIKNHIVRYQITVDGLEDDHNSSRYLTDGTGTWKTIIKNLSYFNQIQDSSVSVLLRSNISPQLYSHVHDWLKFILDNFSGPRFRIHFEAAKDFGHMNDKNFALISNEVDVIEEIIDKSKKWKLPLELVGFRTKPFSMICYAARQSSYIIDYNGEIKKCTSTSLDEPYNCIGSISETGIKVNWKKAAQWTSYKLHPRCESCIILPLCYQRKCPFAKNSFENCALLKRSYIKGLEYFYLP